MIGRLGFYFLLYTFLIFFGTPSFVVVLQAGAIAVCGGVILKNRLLKSDILFPRPFWILLLSVGLYIAFSMMRGLAHAPTTGAVSIRAGVNLVLTLCIPLIAYAYFRQGVLAPKDVVRHFARAVAAFAVVKCSIVLTVAFLAIPIPVLALFFENFFHTLPMFAPITKALIRFSTASDYAVPFALYYCLSDPGRGWINKGAYSLLFLFCLFCSFSRYIWMMAVAALFMSFLLLPRRAAIAVLLASLALSPVAYPWIDFSPVVSRFSANTSGDSDAIRFMQYEALSRDMDGHLLFGHGWATFRVDFIRDATLPYSYEMQWLALLYQIGVVGVLCIAALIALVLLPYQRMSRAEYGMVVLFMLTVLAAFTNPVLLGRSPGAIYAFVAFYGLEAARRKMDNNQLLAAPAA